MNVKHIILNASVQPGPDVPVYVQKNIIDAPEGWPGTNETAVLAGLNENPAWTNDDVVKTYVAQGFSAPGDIVEWAPVPPKAEEAPAEKVEEEVA